MSHSKTKMGKTGRNWEKLGETGKNWEKLGKTGKNWEKLYRKFRTCPVHVVFCSLL
jgi:hypothetical protein